MHKHKAFTIIELLVAIAIIAVMVGLLFPAIGAVRRHAKQTESNTRVRGIIQSMIQASESRRGFFPGFDGFSFTQNSVATTGNSGPGQTAEARHWILLDGNYTTGDGVVSPQESKDVWTTGRVTTDNYSYAMTQINDASVNPNANDRYRREEWRNEQNALAPVVTDRLGISGSILPTPGVPDSYLSMHDDSSEGKWTGSIGRGDLSVEFSTEPTVATRIASYHNDVDDIFTPGDGTGPDPDKNMSVTYRQADNPMGDID